MIGWLVVAGSSKHTYFVPIFHLAIKKLAALLDVQDDHAQDVLFCEIGAICLDKGYVLPVTSATTSEIFSRATPIGGRKVYYFCRSSSVSVLFGSLVLSSVPFARLQETQTNWQSSAASGANQPDPVPVPARLPATHDFTKEEEHRMEQQWKAWYSTARTKVCRPTCGCTSSYTRAVVH